MIDRESTEALTTAWRWPFRICSSSISMHQRASQAQLPVWAVFAPNGIGPKKMRSHIFSMLNPKDSLSHVLVLGKKTPPKTTEDLWLGISDSPALIQISRQLCHGVPKQGLLTRLPSWPRTPPWEVVARSGRRGTNESRSPMRLDPSRESSHGRQTPSNLLDRSMIW